MVQGLETSPGSLTAEEEHFVKVLYHEATFCLEGLAYKAPLLAPVTHEMGVQVRTIL